MAHTFVTDGSGFIGRRLIRRLVADGHAVKVPVRGTASAMSWPPWALSRYAAS